MNSEGLDGFRLLATALPKMISLQVSPANCNRNAIFRLEPNRFSGAILNSQELWANHNHRIIRDGSDLEEVTDRVTIDFYCFMAVLRLIAADMRLFCN